MNFDELEAQVAYLLSQMHDEPENRYELYEELHLCLNEMRATGMPVPDDLAKFERELEKEMQEAQSNNKL